MKRARLLPALALSATLVLSGCTGFGDRAATTEGAVIDGHSYSVEDIQRATAELNGVNAQAATPQQVIGQLVLLPLLREAFAGSPAQSSEAKVRSLLEQGGVQDPSDATVAVQEARQYFAVLQDPATQTNAQLQPAIEKVKQITLERVAQVPVEVNPRFGTWDPKKLQVLPEAPAWITSDSNRS